MIIVITDSLGTGAARAVYKLTSKLTLGEVIDATNPIDQSVEYIIQVTRSARVEKVRKS